MHRSCTTDVFALFGEKLLWHLIVTVNGTILLPPVMARMLMNILRYWHLDFKERKSYIEEAMALSALLSGRLF